MPIGDVIMTLKSRVQILKKIIIRNQSSLKTKKFQIKNIFIHLDAINTLEMTVKNVT